MIFTTFTIKKIVVITIQKYNLLPYPPFIRNFSF